MTYETLVLLILTTLNKTRSRNELKKKSNIWLKTDKIIIEFLNNLVFTIELDPLPTKVIVLVALVALVATGLLVVVTMGSSGSSTYS